MSKPDNNKRGVMMNNLTAELSLLAILVALSVIVYFFAKNRAQKKHIQQEAKTDETQNAVVQQRETDNIEPEPEKSITDSELQTVRNSKKDSLPLDTDILYDLAKGYSHIPEDSTLKRHFLFNLMSEVETGFAPKPTDSTLKRHHESMINDEFVQRLQILSECCHENKVISLPVESIQPPLKSQVQVESHPQLTVIQIPEDSTLKRHFLTHLHSEVEASFPPRPTDSTLKRHYDTMVEVAFEQRVQALEAA